MSQSREYLQPEEISQSAAYIRDVYIYAREVAEKFNGLQDIERIINITTAFKKANSLLSGVFNPTNQSATTPRSHK